MCIHSIEDLMEDFPELEQPDIDRMINPLLTAFPDTPKDRIGEWVVMSFAAVNWERFREDVEHYWERLCSRVIKDVTEQCPHDNVDETEEWVINNLDPLGIVLLCTLRNRFGDDAVHHAVRDLCEVALHTSKIIIAASVGDEVN